MSLKGPSCAAARNDASRASPTRGVRIPPSYAPPVFPPAACAQRRLPFQLLTYFHLANGILPSRVHVFSEESSGLALKFGRPSASYTRTQPDPLNPGRSHSPKHCDCIVLWNPVAAVDTAANI